MTASHFHSHVDDPAAVGRRLKEARLAAGLSQRQLSFPGCSAAYVSRLEAGDRVPSLQLLRKLAQKLHADERYLATGVVTVEQAPPELVEAEVALRLGDDELAKERYGVVLEAPNGPAARERASQVLAQLRGERADNGQRGTGVPGGLDDPAARARVLWQHSRALARAGDPSGAARYARDALALLDYADDRARFGT
jgi:transcriptional regulator with XRE-family HTH domain